MTTKNSMAAKVAARMAKSFAFWNCMALAGVMIFSFSYAAITSTNLNMMIFGWFAASVTTFITGLLLWYAFQDLVMEIEDEEERKKYNRNK
ncbi:MAG: hypothetical protein K2H46_02440 [Muribaculaceae bacterium]|nr:hypothetical protein [Muribaculaceae bacterium]